MADTPEKKVKRKVMAQLKLLRTAYVVTPMSGGFGNSGVPDVLCCYKGRFIGIECKANGGRATALQLHNLNSIDIAGGITFIINESNVDDLTDMIEERINGTT
jgi:Holliday junction resolvase